MRSLVVVPPGILGNGIPWSHGVKIILVIYTAVGSFHFAVPWSTTFRNVSVNDSFVNQVTMEHTSKFATIVGLYASDGKRKRLLGQSKRPNGGIGIFALGIH